MRCTIVIVCCLFVLGIARLAKAQTVASSPAMTNVSRVGINLAFQTNYEESDFMENMFDNPGFEPTQECQIFIVGTASGSGFTTSNDNGEVTGFWNGAAASVRSGTNPGATFTVGT